MVIAPPSSTMVGFTLNQPWLAGKPTLAASILHPCLEMPMFDGR
jgi:hypothetical protein